MVFLWGSKNIGFGGWIEVMLVFVPGRRSGLDFRVGIELTSSE